jgi:hypothetical protein
MNFEIFISRFRNFRTEIFFENLEIPSTSHDPKYEARDDIYCLNLLISMRSSKCSNQEFLKVNKVVLHHTNIFNIFIQNM